MSTLVGFRGWGYGRGVMAGQRSSTDRELDSLVAQLRALEQDIAAARAGATRAARRGLELHARRPPAPTVRGERVRLADGAEIVVRPIEPGDARELALGFRRLGALSRLRRFREPIDHLSEQQLVELTHVDDDWREALVALDAATGEGIAVARWVRVPGDPGRAEVACAVLDAWQGRGVGSALVARLAARASDAGIERCTALIVGGERPARRLLAHVAEEVGERRDGGTIEITTRVRRAAR
jgi:GNAT superfamily N-acetyltransferase